MSLSFHTTQLMYVCMDASTSVPGAQRVKQGAENSEGSFLVLKQQLIWINLRGGRPENMNPPSSIRSRKSANGWEKYTPALKHNNPNVTALRTQLLPQHTQALSLISLPLFQVFFPLVAIHICGPCARLPGGPRC